MFLIVSASAPISPFASTRSFWRFCFFFQAEDGIRYLIVTGVQTCALPICSLVLKCKAMRRTSGPRRLAVPPEQGAGAEDGDGDTDQERADRGDGGIDLQEEAVPHPHGQRLDLDSGEEQRDQQLVERGEEREERRREYAGHGQRQRHP